jgi:hypothetical protein
MKKTNPSFNSFSPFSLSNPFFAQTITIVIVIAIHCNDRQQCMQPALSPPLPPSPVSYHRHCANGFPNALLLRLKSRFRQAATSATKLATATVLPLPPPLPTHGSHHATTAYKINKKEYY